VKEVNKDSSGNTKNKIMSKFPLFLTTLKSTDRQKALRMMFNFLDIEKDHGRKSKLKDLIDEIKESLNDDHQSEILIELGLYSRGLHSYNPDIEKVQLGLSYIAAEKRWNWVLDNAPEFLNKTLGLRAMLNDSACQQQLIEYLKNHF